MATDSKYPQYKLWCNSKHAYLLWYHGWHPPTKICHGFNPLNKDSLIKVVMFSPNIYGLFHYYLWFLTLRSRINTKIYISKNSNRKNNFDTPIGLLQFMYPFVLSAKDTHKFHYNLTHWDIKRGTAGLIRINTFSVSKNEI